MAETYLEGIQKHGRRSLSLSDPGADEETVNRLMLEHHKALDGFMAKLRHRVAELRAEQRAEP